MIEVNHLTKKYGNHYALRDLNFTVEDGKIYGLLGPNGAGKSTCMNILTGYIALTGGEVKINGCDIVTDSENAKKHIGYLPELPPLYPDMKVREYLEFVAELKKVKKEMRQLEIEEVMEKTFIADMQNKLIKNLSKGYKQRVGLAQALLGKPSIIILDEPTVGLDPKQILEIRELILSLKKEHTIILSSHILSEISVICDEIMIISKGKMIVCDTPEGLQYLMKGEDTLELEIKGGKDVLRRLLSTMAGISNFEIEEKSNTDLKEVCIVTEKSFDIREELFYRLAEAKCPIYKLQTTSKSLEDIFLELTSGEGKTEITKNENLTEEFLMEEIPSETEKEEEEI